MFKYEISKMLGSGWLLEIYANGVVVRESQHPSYGYARDAMKAHQASK